jgi:hypothetical protein
MEGQDAGWHLAITTAYLSRVTTSTFREWFGGSVVPTLTWIIQQQWCLHLALTRRATSPVICKIATGCYLIQPKPPKQHPPAPTSWIEGMDVGVFCVSLPGEDLRLTHEVLACADPGTAGRGPPCHTRSTTPVFRPSAKPFRHGTELQVAL